jgi:predicted hotdog family 3-hydroxylacyl-ACP dehydratase
MILLDKIIEFDERSLSAEIVVRENTLLSNSKEVPSWVGIEYMAQAIAAFDVGIVLTVKITKLIHDEKLGVFDCKIYGTGIEISANLNVYQPFNEN